MDCSGEIWIEWHGCIFKCTDIEFKAKTIVCYLQATKFTTVIYFSIWTDKFKINWIFKRGLGLNILKLVLALFRLWSTLVWVRSIAETILIWSFPKFIWEFSCKTYLFVESTDFLKVLRFPSGFALGLIKPLVGLARESLVTFLPFLWKSCFDK